MSARQHTYRPVLMASCGSSKLRSNTSASASVIEAKWRGWMGIEPMTQAVRDPLGKTRLLVEGACAAPPAAALARRGRLKGRRVAFMLTPQHLDLSAQGGSRRRLVVWVPFRRRVDQPR
jgi:hypothetical protein